MTTSTRYYVPPRLTVEDWELEAAIRRATDGFIGSATIEQRRRWADQQKALISQRSDAMVEFLERARGLR